MILINKYFLLADVNVGSLPKKKIAGREHKNCLSNLKIVIHLLFGKQQVDKESHKWQRIQWKYFITTYKYFHLFLPLSFGSVLCDPLFF